MVMSTNAGRTVNNTIAEVPGFRQVWFDEKVIANIFGFANMKKRHHIVYDSDKEDAFLIYTDNGIIMFEATPEGLYCYKVTPGYLETI